MKQLINKYIDTKSLLIVLSIVALFCQSVQINLLINQHNNLHQHSLVKSINNSIIINAVNNGINNNDTVFSKKTLNIKDDIVLKINTINTINKKSNFCHSVCVHTVCCNSIQLILPVDSKIYIKFIDTALDFLDIYHLYTFYFISVIYKPNWF